MRKFFLAVIILSNFGLQAQTLLKVGNTEISVPEFLWVYEKSNGSVVHYDEKSLRSYLDLYINFRLKVLDAEAQNLDHEASFKEELAGYRARLADRFLLDREVTDKLIREAYKRSLKIVNASHLLILCAPDASPADTLKAYTKIADIRKQALSGISFSDLAAKYSEEPGAAERKGLLGNFSVFQMVYAFENAAYETPKGQISSIVRTRFGYHLVKVNDVLPNRGQIEVAHIMVATPKNQSAADSISAYNKAFEIYKRAVAGEKFGVLAKQYSDDKESALKDGVLPVLTIGQTVKSFENATLALKSEGDISKPIKTDFGWHIIKLIRKIPLPPYDQMKEMLKNKVSSDERSALSQEIFLSRLKKQYNFSENPETQSIIAQSDSALAKVNPGQSLFTVNGNPILLGEFTDYVNDSNPGKSPKKATVNSYRDFVAQKLIGLENKNLESKYPDFKYLMNEYHNGILLYTISDQKIWSFAQTDTIGLKNFYSSVSDNYKWKQRADASVYIANSQANLAETKLLLQQNMPKDSILAKINSTNPLNLVINDGIFERGENLFLDRAKWQKNTDSEVTVGNSYAIIKVKDIYSPTKKNLSEIKGTVLADYQSRLDEEWIKQLHQKYQVTINQAELKKLVRK